jgi:hypothetical protein
VHAQQSRTIPRKTDTHVRNHIIQPGHINFGVTSICVSDFNLAAATMRKKNDLKFLWGDGTAPRQRTAFVALCGLDLDLEAGVACFFAGVGVLPLVAAFLFRFTVGVSAAGVSADTPAANTKPTQPHTHSPQESTYDSQTSQESRGTLTDLVGSASRRWRRRSGGLCGVGCGTTSRRTFVPLS